MLDQLCTLHYVLEIVSMNSHCPSCFYYLRDLSDRNQTSPGDVMIIQYWRRLPLSNITAQKTLSRRSNRFFVTFCLDMPQRIQTHIMSHSDTSIQYASVPLWKQERTCNEAFKTTFFLFFFFSVTFVRGLSHVVIHSDGDGYGWPWFRGCFCDWC